jgi:tetratricopeptide (TPR) repeat protein
MVNTMMATQSVMDMPEIVDSQLSVDVPDKKNSLCTELNLDDISALETFSQFNQWFESWRSSSTDVKPETLVDFFVKWTDVIRKMPPSKQLESDSTNQPVRIVLNVMMKNEQPLMRRCIQSALPIVDAVSYSDTGSTGDVFTILKSIVPASVPLCVEVDPWRDFGYNRTSGLNQTKRFVERMGWDPKKTYILVIDADMILQISPSFEKQNLSSDSYVIAQHNGSMVYQNIRLVRVFNQWEVIGRTHEYYSSKIPAHQTNLDTLKIDDRNDGLNRSNKYRRDIELLLKDLEENPKNARANFYLAETHRNSGNKELGDFEKAIKYYQRHIEIGSWEEEVWWSKYAIGMCFDSLGNEGMMLAAYLEAFQRRPHRAEPLFKIAKYYCSRNQHWNAMVFFKRAAEIPFPSSDILFIDKTVYMYQIMSEMSISAYYAGEKSYGSMCIQTLLRNRDIPHSVRDMAYYNARFYLKQFPSTRIIPLNPKLPHPYRPCNPSIAIRNNKLLIACRGVNYDQRNARNYKPLDGSGRFHTINSLMTLDLNTLELEKDCLIQNNIQGPYVSTCNVQGLEDARLVVLNNGSLAFSCTSLEYTQDNRPRICWVPLEENNGNVRVSSVTRIRGHKDDEVQKNWLPFLLTNGSVKFIYNYNPFTVLDFEPSLSKVTPQPLKVNFPVETCSWRGSSGPVHIPNQGQLILVHEVCDRPEGRHYMHRFVLFDETFSQWKSSSDLFYFKHKDGVEMATGMVYCNDKIYVTIGIEDHEAYLLTCHVNDILNSLNQ